MPLVRSDPFAHLQLQTILIQNRVFCSDLLCLCGFRLAQYVILCFAAHHPVIRARARTGRRCLAVVHLVNALSCAAPPAPRPCALEADVRRWRISPYLLLPLRVNCVLLLLLRHVCVLGC